MRKTQRAPVSRRDAHDLSKNITHKKCQLLLRRTKGCQELAHICGLHRIYIGAVERGERNVTLSTLEALADALGVAVPELLTFQDSSEKQIFPSPNRAGVKLGLSASAL